jgi:hypothetical protein
MKALAAFLRRVAEWLDPSPPPLVPPAIADAARRVTLEVSGQRHTPAYRRVVAWRLLRQQFPLVRDRVLFLAIELSLH